MTFRSIESERDNLTIMGVPFPDLPTFDRMISSIGTAMF
jgi:hypothetical protein